MIRFPFRFVGVLVLLLRAWVMPLSAMSLDEVAAGQALSRKYADALVGIEAVVRFKIPNGNREQRLEANGTMINEKGLVVTSLILIDPRMQLEATRATMEQGGAQMRPVESEYKEITLHFSDGTEVPARFVLKDAEHDLAFLAPVSESALKERQFTWVKLTPAAEPDLLSPCFSIGKMQKICNACSLSDPAW